ncbi:MAG TPA: GNAT family N-acetyltransferase [Patescibacteria group bacterium]|jgi:GNAT superfamily N-acetyltransferase|nr:GNAT family N-acetyltransferase [Patescibacteria group bacterium]
MPLIYRFDYPVLAEMVATVFRSSGIRRPVDDLPRIQKMLDHADLTVTVWDGERLVGIGRVLTDFSYCCYLSDLAVDLDYQRQGIGRAMVSQIRAHLGREVMILLLAAPEAMAYYPHIGFEKADNAWIIHRE